MATSENIGAMKSHKNLRKQIESIKKQKIAARKIVSLEEFRLLKTSSESPTVLVVDDDEIMRNAIKRILEAEGYEIALAKDGLELSKIIEARRLDLILLDVNLPWVDGIELCQLIKSHHSLKNVPLILISGRKSREDIERGFEAGCDDFIGKPFEVDHITSVIRERIAKSS
ncbi:MAG: response regulator [Oligoflexales bacterium]|nr:response regulator [Oligoflexales bacterium]